MSTEILIKQEFKQEKNIEKLKCSRSAVNFDDKIIKTSTDKRFYWDGERFGVHVSGPETNPLNIPQLFASCSDMLPFLEVLYIGNSSLHQFDTVQFKQAGYDLSSLQYLCLRDNATLEKIHLNNLPKLEILHADCCEQLNYVSLNGDFSKLKQLDVSWSVIKELNLAKAILPSLRYILARTEGATKILWPSKLENIIQIDIADNSLLEDDIKPIVKLSGYELRKALNAYLKIYNKGKGVDKEYQLKLILIGNTGAGKSTLRRILQSEEGKAAEAAKDHDDGTHGAEIFSKTFSYSNEENKINDLPQEVYVQGFDFGGQDYYHSTHLPFYDKEALNILVFGQDELPELPFDPACDFKLKGRKELNEKHTEKTNQADVVNDSDILYPLNYWMGSLSYRKEREPQKEKVHNENSIAPDDDEETQALTRDSKEDNTSQNSTLELIQNKRQNQPSLELNTLLLRKQERITVGDIVAFDFEQESETVKTWLKNKIRVHAKVKTVVTKDKEAATFLKEQEQHVFSFEELLTLNKTHNWYETETDLREALKRLVRRHEGYYFQPDETFKEEFFIPNISDFSKWIHEHILTKDLLGDGYFSDDDIQKGTSKKYARWAMLYLKREDIVFDVKYDVIGFSPKKVKAKYVAPAYLPMAKPGLEKLFLDSFDTPDCIFTFDRFFHSNIIMMLIASFKDELVSESEKKEYLLWKNKVVLYQQKQQGKERLSDKERNEKAFLLIELKYPGIDDLKGSKPQLSISRNYSGFVQDSRFHDVFKFIYDMLFVYGPQVEVKTKFGNYIPHQKLEETCIGNKERSYLIYHDRVFYSRFDFRHFWLDEHNLNPTKFFIAYSRHDVDYVHELMLHLQPFVHMGKILVFYDLDLSMGEKWNAATRHELETSDVVLCMVSPNMLNTSIVMDEELPLANDKYKIIVPIILKPCNWDFLEFNRGYNLLTPHNAYRKAEVLSSDSHKRNEQWKDISLKLSQLLPKNINWDRKEPTNDLLDF